MKVNDKVKGSYCNVTFSGTISYIRMITVPADGAFEVTVILDEEVEIFSTTRERLLLVVKHDGSPSSYTGYSEWLRVH